jgi:adenine-specific DNA-methyltransferase
MKTQKMSGKSYNPQDDLLALFKQQAPEIFSDDKVDCEKLKKTLGELVEEGGERYGLSWAGKSDCFRVIQEPTTATLKPSKEESVDFDSTENLFIEGDNLEVLKVLQKSYYGKVKMIYIDPPYNTGNDFIYNDNFRQSRGEYLESIGEKDENGNLRRDGLMRNSRDKGHYHSDWLSMMYPRLFLAKNLLRRDGVIFVSIDDNEVHNLRMLMNEIFGEENFIAEFVWKRRASSALSDYQVSTDHEYILAYQKGDFDSFLGTNKDYSGYSNSDNDERGDWTLGDLTVGMTKDQRPNQFYELVDPNTENSFKPNANRVWAYVKESMDKLIAENRIYFPSDTSKKPMLKRYKNELKNDKNPVSTLIPSKKNGNVFFTGLNSEGTKQIQELFDSKLIDYPKPMSLIASLARQIAMDGDVVLDFFAGSGTTAHAVMALNAEDGGNRKCISVQLPEMCDEASEAYKAGFKTIADIAKERIRRAGEKMSKAKEGKLDLEEEKLDLGFKVFKLDKSNFKIWQSNIENDADLAKQMDLFIDNLKKDSEQTNVLFELILKSGLDLNVSVEEKKQGAKKYFVVNDDSLVICLEDKIDQALVDAILTEKPAKVICLDKSFGGNDQLKTNTTLQMESAKIDFKVI